jgi:hypothetical protein
MKLFAEFLTGITLVVTQIHNFQAVYVQYRI